MSEFDIIKQYFAARVKQRQDIVVGIGDDAAIVTPPLNSELAVTTDTLTADIHFPGSTHPSDIGHKSLAVNLSDLAAMGATPLWATLALTLPKADDNWLKAFCDGFFALADIHHIQLIGGDLTHGPLSITIQAIGFTPPGKALLRSQANPGDLIYVTGTLGDAGLALRLIQQQIVLDIAYQHDVLERFNRPTPRIEAGERLRSFSGAAIDISDGLAADLKHILKQSNTGAIIYVDQLPLSDALACSLSPEHARGVALTAGDDYELCFTIPSQHRAAFEVEQASFPCRLTCIGKIREQSGLELIDQNGKHYHDKTTGYQHF